MSDISPITESIRLYAKQLRVPSFAIYSEILRHADGGMGYEEFLLELMKKELETRRENQQKRRTRAAGFPFLKTLDEFDYSRLEHVEEAFIWELATCDYIEKRQNIIMIGNPGSGKSHLSIGLGLKAIKEGFNVKFYTAASLATALVEAREFKSLGKLEKQIHKADLLILDELSYLSFNRYQSELLFKVISDRSEKASVIVTTNLPFSKWTELFENPTMITALVDRLTFRSHVLNMNGESFRKNQSKVSIN
ncbi:MAG: ATP-binding protein [Clostridiales bacterium]|nr:ATP-binding protein [Clostridiales bacterium]